MGKRTFRELKADANGKTEPTGTGEDKAEEPPHGFSADQEARHDGQAERGPNAEDSRPFDPLRSSSVNRLNRLQDSANRLNRLQDSANRLSRLQNSGILDSVLSRLQNSGILDSELSRLQNSGILDSELSRLHSSGILDSLNQLQDSLVRSQMEAANTFSSAFSQITQGLARSFSLPNLFESPFTGFLRSLPPLVNPKARVAEELGWVVHRTLPTTVLEDASEDNLDEAIMTHYKERWAEVRREIELATSGYLIDEDSKETMSQILSAHEYGLYRLVPVAIMVEIERAARVHLYGKLVGRHLDIKGKIVDEIGELPISAFQDITSGIIQHETLENHLYEHIDDDGDRSQFAENPIPNRHAAIHGLVPYSTEKSSLNSIFLADFVLQMITEIKREKIAEIADILRGGVLGAKSA